MPELLRLFWMLKQIVRATCIQKLWRLALKGVGGLLAGFLSLSWLGGRLLEGLRPGVVEVFLSSE